MNNVSYIIVACYPDKGMKSYGSKSLIDFNKKKLIEYQIEQIYKIHKKAEIIIISDFEINKFNKIFNQKITVIELKKYNPIYLGCKFAKNNLTVFIDYGCIFKSTAIEKLVGTSILCFDNSISKKTTPQIGCIVENNDLKHIFLDLPDNKFCNIFALSHEDKNKILQNTDFGYNNLLSFEIVNKLIASGSSFNVKFIKNNDLIHFNSMRQKNAVNKFIKTISN